MDKRILIISPVPTHPHTAGNRARVSMMLSSLMQMGYDVQFMHVEMEHGDVAEMQREWGESYHAAAYQKPEKNHIQRLVRKLRILVNSENRYIYAADEWWDKSVDPVIRKLNAKFKFNVVIVEYIFFSKALNLFDSSVIKMIDTHDIFSNRHKLYLQKNMKPEWYSTSEKQEAKALNRADIVIAIQNREEEFFRKLTTSKVITVGHGVTVIPPVAKNITNKILYVASQNPMNLESIRWFIDKVLVLIKKKIPDAELLLVGRICECVEASEGVVKLGVLDKLDMAYEQSDVVINPVLCGTGLKIKNVEAMGYSKALVTTPLGAEGLEDVAGEVFLVGDDENSFAANVMRVLLDRQYNEELANRAFNFTTAWNAGIMSGLKEAIES